MDATLLDIVAAFLPIRIVVEVKFADSFVYFDRCGSTTSGLCDLLGKGFAGAVPDMRSAQIESAAERLKVEFNWSRFSVHQNWVDTPVRVSNVAEKAWKFVAQKLQVRHSTSRVGMRTFFLLEVPDREEGQTILDKLEFLSLGGSYSDLASQRPEGMTVLLRLDGDNMARVSLEHHELPETTPILDREYRRFMPRFSIQLDIDYFRAVNAELSPSDLHEFMRAAWKWSESAKRAFEGRAT